jgi:hypothetical protein
MRAIGFGPQEHFEQARSAQIKHGMTLARGEVAQRTGEIAFAHAGGPCQEHRLMTGDPVDGGEFQESLFI